MAVVKMLGRQKFRLGYAQGIANVPMMALASGKAVQMSLNDNGISVGLLPIVLVSLVCVWVIGLICERIGLIDADHGRLYDHMKRGSKEKE